MSAPSAHWVRGDGYLKVQIADAVIAHALPRESRRGGDCQFRRDTRPITLRAGFTDARYLCPSPLADGCYLLAGR